MSPYIQITNFRKLELTQASLFLACLYKVSPQPALTDREGLARADVVTGASFTFFSVFIISLFGGKESIKCVTYNFIRVTSYFKGYQMQDIMFVFCFKLSY